MCGLAFVPGSPGGASEKNRSFVLPRCRGAAVPRSHLPKNAVATKMTPGHRSGVERHQSAACSRRAVLMLAIPERTVTQPHADGQSSSDFVSNAMTIMCCWTSIEKWPRQYLGCHLRTRSQQARGPSDGDSPRSLPWRRSRCADSAAMMDNNKFANFDGIIGYIQCEYI